MFDFVKKVYSVNKEMISSEIAKSQVGEKAVAFANKAGEKISAGVNTVTHTSLADIGNGIAESKPVQVYKSVAAALKLQKELNKSNAETQKLVNDIVTKLMSTDSQAS